MGSGMKIHWNIHLNTVWNKARGTGNIDMENNWDPVFT